jgi:hypothetical protein
MEVKIKNKKILTFLLMTLIPCKRLQLIFNCVALIYVGLHLKLLP